MVSGMTALYTGDLRMQVRQDLGRATRLVASVALALAVVACAKKPDAPAPRASLTVTAQVVNVAPLPRKVNASGTVAAWQDIPVASETGGLTVTAVLVDEGSRVRQGQQLVQLDDRVLRAQLRQAAAAVASAEAMQAQNDAALKRSTELRGKGFLSQAALDTSIANQKTAAAQVLTAKAALGEAQAKLDQSVIRAPTAGLITSRTVVKGMVISVGSELFRLVRDDQLEMNAQIPEADLHLVQPGMSAVVTGAQGTTTGRVRLVTPQVDPQTRLGLARITLPPSSPFRNGNFATAAIDVGAVPVLSVAQEAIVFRDGKPGLFVIGPGDRVHYVQVTTGTRDSGLVEITSGLTPGSRVVTQGGGFLGEGDRVAIAPALPNTGGA
jgi:RND family efflux transporter MFP subunit